MSDRIDIADENLPIGMVVARYKAENAELRAQLAAAQAENQRLTDLVRYKRGELHTDGLIDDDEYSRLVQVDGAVARLEGYDAIKAQLAAANEELTGVMESYTTVMRGLGAERQRAERAEAECARLREVLRELDLEIVERFQRIEAEVGPDAMVKWSRPDPMVTLMYTYLWFGSALGTIRTALTATPPSAPAKEKLPSFAYDGAYSPAEQHAEWRERHAAE